MDDEQVQARWAALVNELERHGMQSLWDELEQRLRQLGTPPRLVLVAGEPGAGKTIAVRKALDQLLERGIARPTAPVRWQAAISPEAPAPALDVDVVRECILAGFLVALVLWIAWPVVMGALPPQPLDRLLQGALIALPLAFQQRGR